MKKKTLGYVIKIKVWNDLSSDMMGYGLVRDGRTAMVIPTRKMANKMVQESVRKKKMRKATWGNKMEEYRIYRLIENVV